MNKAEKISFDKKVLFSIIIGIILSMMTNVIAETLIKSADVSYVDNSNLKATNVQAAIDGTCTKFSNDLATILDKMYPIGSIYISTSLSTPAQVGSAIGGTWESYGKGQTLVGVDTSQTEFNSVGKTGGEKVHTLTIDEMPSHTHIQNSHSHSITTTLGFYDRNSVGHSWSDDNQNFIIVGKGFNGATFIEQSNVLTSYKNTSTTAINQETGGSKSHNNLQPYITVYMYRRTK